MEPQVGTFLAILQSLLLIIFSKTVRADRHYKEWFCKPPTNQLPLSQNA
jgi:hypothetical protein